MDFPKLIIKKHFNDQISERSWYINYGILHSDHGPARMFFNRNGVLLDEMWYQNGHLDRSNGPAHVKYDEDGLVIEEIWYRNGMIHREDGPALIGFSQNKRFEQWYQYHLKHRKDGPALIEYSLDDGSVSMETWYQKNLRHREDGPALIIYHLGKKSEEWWYLNGRPSRMGGPAVIKYDNGLISEENWYLNGKLHRDDDLPAIMTYHFNGKVFSEFWYQWGRLFRTDGPVTVQYHPNGIISGADWPLDKKRSSLAFREEYNQRGDPFRQYFMHRDKVLVFLVKLNLPIERSCDICYRNFIQEFQLKSIQDENRCLVCQENTSGQF